MGLMEVNGIRVFAYHGCLEEEGRIGGHFRVDIAVEGDLDRAETSDRLEHAVDYGRVTAIVKEQMAVRSQPHRACGAPHPRCPEGRVGSRVALACTPGEGAPTDQWRCGRSGVQRGPILLSSQPTFPVAWPSG
jgi:hypothetical protein